MNTKSKQKLIDNYNTLKNKKVPRWEAVMYKNKDEVLITNSSVKKHMADEIEELRMYISKLKSLATRILNHE